MAGRKHHLTCVEDTRLPHSSSSSATRALPVATLEDRIEARHREIQSLRLDNQRLTASHVALKQDLAATQQELCHLSGAVAEVEAERDVEGRRIYKKSLKMDAEVRAIAAMTSELDQVRADVSDLDVERKELVSHSCSRSRVSS